MTQITADEAKARRFSRWIGGDRGRHEPSAGYLAHRLFQAKMHADDARALAHADGEPDALVAIETAVVLGRRQNESLDRLWAASRRGGGVKRWHAIPDGGPPSPRGSYVDVDGAIAYASRPSADAAWGETDDAYRMAQIIDATVSRDAVAAWRDAAWERFASDARNVLVPITIDHRTEPRQREVAAAADLSTPESALAWVAEQDRVYYAHPTADLVRSAIYHWQMHPTMIRAIGAWALLMGETDRRGGWVVLSSQRLADIIRETWHEHP